MCFFRDTPNNNRSIKIPFERITSSVIYLDKPSAYINYLMMSDFVCFFFFLSINNLFSIKILVDKTNQLKFISFILTAFKNIQF